MKLKIIQKALLVALLAIFAISSLLVMLAGTSPWVAMLWTVLNMIGTDFPPDVTLVDAPNFLLLAGFALDIVGSIIVTIFLTTILYQILGRIDIQRLLSNRKARGMKGHYVLAPINQFSLDFAEGLRRRGMGFVMIDANRSMVSKALEMDLLAIDGNETMQASMKYAKVDRAKGLFLFSDDQIQNVLASITARRLNKNIEIFSRVRKEEDIARNARAGINHMIMPEFAIGDELGRFMLQKLTA